MSVLRLNHFCFVKGTKTLRADDAESKNFKLRMTFEMTTDGKKKKKKGIFVLKSWNRCDEIF